MDYITVYLEIIALTFVYMGVLFFNVRSEMGNKREVEIFRAILMFMALALVADSITQIQYRGFANLPPLLVAFLYGFYMFVFSGVLPFLWLVFVELRLGSSLLRKRGALIVSAIPLMFVSVMAFASIKTGWFFRVDEYGIYTRGDYWSLQVIVNYCYFLFTTIHALIAAKTEPSPVQRKSVTPWARQSSSTTFSASRLEWMSPSMANFLSMSGYLSSSARSCMSAGVVSLKLGAKFSTIFTGMPASSAAWQSSVTSVFASSWR